jgi:hypothetical protein
MPLTGLFALSVSPGQTSPSSALISHISRSFPAEPLSTFYLDHRLFVDTSSILPNSDTALRKSTSILTLSHTPASTYLATASPKAKSQGAEPPSQSSTLITIPSNSADAFTHLIGTKLQPLWTHRQSVVLENGTALSLNNGEWVVRIGDLKVPPRPNQTGSNVRGMLLEVTHLEDRPKPSPNNDAQDRTKDQAVAKEDETLLRGFLDSVTEGSGVNIASPDAVRSLIRHTSFDERDKGTTSVVPDFELAGLYLDILRGSRG